MEYELETLVPDIDDHIFDVENNGDDDIGDEEEETTINKGAIVSRICLTDLVEMGWNKLQEINVKKVRMVVNEWVQWKRKTARYIMDRAAAMKQELITTTIPLKQDTVKDSEWVVYLCKLRYGYYN